MAELPIHFIGHSRGCSLNSRLIYLLALSGVLVDQVTTLDPHPVTPPGGNDWIPETFINVLFADNYYEQGPLNIPDGMPIPGAINLDISVSFLGDIGSIPHTHVHTYYHGTIDTSTNAVDGVNINSTWYLTFDRDKVGYNYSRFYPTLPRPAAGINQFISGAGGTGSRVSVDPSQQLWSNAGFDQRSVVPSVVTVGDSVDIPYYFADRYSLQIITFYTDNDTNPYNGEQAQIGYTTQPPQSDGTIGTNLFHWHPTAADIGTHYIRVKAVNSSGYTRYDYLFQPITVRAAQPLVPAIISVTPATLTASASAQPITISGYNFNPPSDPNASMTGFTFLVQSMS